MRVEVNFELDSTQALALAQLVKRIGFSDVEANAAGREEAYIMLEAIELLRMAMAEAGFAPR